MTRLNLPTEGDDIADHSNELLTPKDNTLKALNTVDKVWNKISKDLIAFPVDIPS